MSTTTTAVAAPTPKVVKKKKAKEPEEEEEEESDYQPLSDSDDDDSSEEEEDAAITAASATEKKEKDDNESVVSSDTDSSDEDESSSSDEEDGDNEEEEETTKKIVKKATTKSKPKPKAKAKSVTDINMDHLVPIEIKDPKEIDFTPEWSVIEEEKVINEDGVKKNIKREYTATSRPSYKHPLPYPKRIQKKGRSEEEVKTLESNKKKWESLLTEKMFICLEHVTPDRKRKHRMVMIDANNVIRDWDYKLAKQVASKELIASAIENKNRAYTNNPDVKTVDNMLRARLILPQILYEKELAAHNKSTASTSSSNGTSTTAKKQEGGDHKKKAVSVIKKESTDPKAPSNRAKIAALSRMNVMKNILNPEIYYALCELDERYLQTILSKDPKAPSLLTYQEQLMAMHQTIIFDNESFDTTMTVVDSHPQWKSKLEHGKMINGELYCPPFITLSTTTENKESTPMVVDSIAKDNPRSKTVILPVEKKEKQEETTENKKKKKKKNPSTKKPSSKRKTSPVSIKQSKNKKKSNDKSTSAAASVPSTTAPLPYMDDLELDSLVK